MEELCKKITSILGHHLRINGQIISAFKSSTVRINITTSHIEFRRIESAFNLIDGEE
jgi:hypothetical protein